MPSPSSQRFPPGRRRVAAPRRSLLTVVAIVAGLVAVLAPGTAAPAHGRSRPVSLEAESVGRQALERPLLSLDRLPGAVEGITARVGLDRRIDAALASPTYAQGCVVVGGAEGDAVWASDDGRGYVPASAMKLLVSAVAERTLPHDERYTTSVLRGADGTLYLVGGGNPVLSTPERMEARPERLATPLQGLADQIRAKGVGVPKIVADASFFDDAFLVEGWDERYVREGSAPHVSALAVDRGRAKFPDEMEKEIPDVERVEGDPALLAAIELGRLLGNAAVPVSRGEAPEDAEVVAELASPTLRELLTEMNKHSDNMIAETILRHVGLAEGDGTTSGGLRVVREELEDLEVDMDATELYDGSGLHRGNRVACATFLSLMRSMEDEPGSGAWFSTFAVGGTDGTLEDRGLPVQVQAKTGTLRDVSTLVGRVDTGTDPLFFAFLFNAVERPWEAQLQQDALVDAIDDWPAG